MQSQKIEVMMEEYKTLRDEVGRTPVLRLQILSIGMASAALLVAGAVSAITVGKAMILPGLVLLLIVPIICWTAFHSWLTEATRGRRASFYLRGIERRVNSELNDRVLAWEEELRESCDPQMRLFRGHYWSVWGVFSLTGALSGAIGAYFVTSGFWYRYFPMSILPGILGAIVVLGAAGVVSAFSVPRVVDFKQWDEPGHHWPPALPWRRVAPISGE